MFEGKEVDGKIGEYGAYSLDINDVGVVAIDVGLRVDLIAELRKLALKTDNSLDDKVVDIIEHLISKKPV